MVGGLLDKGRVVQGAGVAAHGPLQRLGPGACLCSFLSGQGVCLAAWPPPACQLFILFYLSVAVVGELSRPGGMLAAACFQ